MKRLIILLASVSLISGNGQAQDIVLPTGMSALTSKDIQVTSVNIEGRTNASKPIVATSNNQLFFTAQNDASGEELWVSGLTPETTRMVKDINPEAEGSNPKWLTVIGEKVYFVATTPDAGEELWVSNGTAEGTYMVKDIYPGTAASSPFGLTALGDKLSFYAMDEESEALPVIDPTKPEKWLWVSDGTAAGTTRIAETPTSRETGFPGMEGHLTPCGNKVFFIGYDHVNNESLWITDGTREGTKMLKNVNPKRSSGPTFETEAGVIGWMTNVNDKWMVFRAETVQEITGTEDVGSEIWVSDGTEEGTKWIGVDFGKGKVNGVPRPCDLTTTKAYGDTLYFRGSDGIHGVEPCVFILSQPVVDGVNPRMFFDINHWNNDPSRPSWALHFMPFKGDLYVRANGGYFLPHSATPTQELGSGNSLWRGPVATLDTMLYAAQIWDNFEIFSGNNSDNACYFTIVNNKLFFQAQDAADNRELWMIDDPAVPPVKVVDLPGDGIPCQLRGINNDLYFVSEGVKMLFKYDLTGGTGIINPKTGNSNITVYPNPASDYITISGSEQSVAKLQAFDIGGKIVAESYSENRLEVANLASGLYLLKVIWEDRTQSTAKFLVK